MAGLFLIAVGIFGLLYLVLGRNRIKRAREHEREMPWEHVGIGWKLMADLPFGVAAAIQAVACLAVIALGLWALSNS